MLYCIPNDNTLTRLIWQLFAAMYIDLLNEHRKTQGVERKKLAKHRGKCYRRPEKYLGICIDGMDQKKTKLPHFLHCPKNMDEKYFIPIHVVGCLVINGTLKSKVFLNYPNINNDSNLTVHAIQHILKTWEGPLPPVLYVQLDKTSRENKNKFMMAYLNMLVEKGIFKKIKVGFLLVGHTHDQIDQMFSRFSTKLNKQRAFRLDSLEEIIVDSYTPKPEIIFVDEVADFKKFVTDKDQLNRDGVLGTVLVALNGIRNQKQFRIRQVVGKDGFPKTEFQAKHLSSSKDWGESVNFLRYIPTSPMWVAPQMALKSTGGNNNGKQGKDIEPGSDDDEPATCNIPESTDLKVLKKYCKAIIDKGFTYFRDQDKLWWIKFFEKQEEILRNHLEPAQWRFEWTWPVCTPPLPASVEEIQLPIPRHLLEKVAGPQNIMYSGRRRAPESFGDYRDLETSTKYAMICVKADKDPKKKPFWLAKVMEILTKVDGVPDKVKITWYAMDSNESALDGRYFPEKSKSSKKFMEDELCLSETTVYAYKFALLGNKALLTATRRIIEAALNDSEIEAS